MHTFQANAKADPHCTIARIGESLRKRARAHEMIARHFRKAVKQLQASVKLLGDPDEAPTSQSRAEANLRASLFKLHKVEIENASLLAQVLGDEPTVGTVAEAAE